MAAGNLAGSALKFGGGMVSNLFRNLLGALIFLGIIIIFIGGINGAIEQKSFKPFLDEVVGRVVRADQNLYDKAIEIKELGGLPIISDTPLGKVPSFFKSGAAIFDIAVNIYFIFLVFLVIFKVVGSVNLSAGFGNFLITGAFLAVLLISFQAVILAQEGVQDEETLVKKLVPFRGVANIIVVSPKILNPIIQSDIIQKRLPDNTGEVTLQDNQGNGSGCGADVCL